MNTLLSTGPEAHHVIVASLPTAHSRQLAETDKTRVSPGVSPVPAPETSPAQEI